MNEQQDKESKKIRRLTNIEFYKLTEAIKTHREVISSMTQRKQVVAFLEKETGLPCSMSSVGDILEATGVTLAMTKHKNRSERVRCRISYANRVLATNLKAVLEALGMPVSNELQGLCNAEVNEVLNVENLLGPQGEQKLTEMKAELDRMKNPIPLKNVLDTKKINIVNGK